MFNSNSPKPVDIILVENTGIDGEHVPAGTVLLGVPADLAMELACQGKARVATEAEVKKAKASE